MKILDWPRIYLPTVTIYCAFMLSPILMAVSSRLIVACFASSVGFALLSAHFSTISNTLYRRYFYQMLWSPLGIGVLLMFGYFTLSLMWSVNPNHTTDSLLKVGAMGLLFLLFAAACPFLRWDHLNNALFLGLSIACLLLLVQYALPQSNFPDFVQQSSWHTNNRGIVVATVLSALLPWSLRLRTTNTAKLKADFLDRLGQPVQNRQSTAHRPLESNFRQLALQAAIVWLFVVVLVALSKSDSARLFLLVYLVSCGITFIIGSRPIFYCAVVFGTGIVFFPSLLLHVFQLRDGTQLTASFAGNLLDLESLSQRIEIWRQYIGLIREAPLIGWGFGTENNLQSIGYTHPHSMPLEIWVTLGAAGAVGVASLLCAFAYVIANHQTARMFAPPVLLAIFSVWFVSHGAWQGWWLATIFLTVVPFTVTD